MLSRFLRTYRNHLAIVALVIAFAVIALPGRASAATLAVDTDCTLPEALGAVNAASNGNGCVAVGSYGSADTINLPAGTQTMSANLPAIQKSVIISGAGTVDTVVNFGGHLGFNANFSSASPSTKNITFEKMSLANANPQAITIQNALAVTIDNVDISGSKQAINLQQTDHNIISNTVLHDNSDSSSTKVGIFIEPGSAISGTAPETVIDRVKIVNNTGSGVGLQISPRVYRFGTVSEELDEGSVTVKSSVIMDNQAAEWSGVLIVASGGPLSPVPFKLHVDATTIADNSVAVTTPQTANGSSTPVLSGFLISGGLASQQHFTNVTVANNTVSNPAPDNRNTVAGFLASLTTSSSDLNILNTTVVNNSVTQAAASSQLPAFFAIKISLNGSYQPTQIVAGATAGNVLIAKNTFNGATLSCQNQFDSAAFGLSGLVDISPRNEGYNMADDAKCTGYTQVANLYDTIDHEVRDNGGLVPTLKLLPGSPAIDGGGQVLGISTDARGVARSGHYSVGAYQGELLAASTTANHAGVLANTGTVIWGVAAGLLVIVLIIFAYTYFDYLRHRKPLVAADPHASETYTFQHHVKAVSIPLLRYRVQITFNRQPTNISRF